MFQSYVDISFFVSCFDVPTGLGSLFQGMVPCGLLLHAYHRLRNIMSGPNLAEMKHWRVSLHLEAELEMADDLIDGLRIFH